MFKKKKKERIIKEVRLNLDILVNGFVLLVF